MPTPPPPAHTHLFEGATLLPFQLFVCRLLICKSSHLSAPPRRSIEPSIGPTYSPSISLMNRWSGQFYIDAAPGCIYNLLGFFCFFCVSCKMSKEEMSTWRHLVTGEIPPNRTQAMPGQKKQHICMNHIRQTVSYHVDGCLCFLSTGANEMKGNSWR